MMPTALNVSGRIFCRECPVILLSVLSIYDMLLSSSGFLPNLYHLRGSHRIFAICGSPATVGSHH